MKLGTTGLGRAAQAALLLAAPAFCGCKAFGIFAYVFVDPLIPEPEVQARCTLPEGTIAVIVDTRGELAEDGPPKLPDLVARRTVEELTKHVTDRKFVPAENVIALRRKTPARYARMGNAELGNRLHAETLLKIELHGYRQGSPEAGDRRMGNVQVLVRLVDGLSDDNVLWPHSEPYEIFSISTGTFNPNEDGINEYKVLDSVAEAAADRIAKMFYKYRPPKHDVGDRPD